MRILLALFSLAIIGFFSMSAPLRAMAQTSEETVLDTTAANSFFDRFFVYDQMSIVWIATAVVFFVVFIIVMRTPRSNAAKALSFFLIAATALFTTFYISGETLYTIKRSPTGGPVHWHADFRIFDCGEEVDLLDPTGFFSNRIGSPLLHEHGDGRIHVEGIPSLLEATAPDAFFEIIGGELTDDKLVVPVHDGFATLQTGNMCNGTATGTLQIFLWETDTEHEPWRVHQQKLADFAHYVMRPEALVPPGDCLIFELGPVRERTEHLCGQYEVALQRGDIVIEQ